MSETWSLPEPLPQGHPPEPPLPPAHRRAWGPWATLAWGVLVYALYSGIQSVVVLTYLIASGTSLTELADADSYLTAPGIGPATALAVLLAAPVALGLVWILSRVRLPPSRVLALVKPTFRQILVWSGALLAFLVASELLAGWLDRPPVPDFVKGLWTTTEGPFVPLLILAIVIVGPLFEEIVVRGFLFHGLGEGWAAILITTVLFTAAHAGQYDAFDLGWVAALSLVLGLARKQSGSTLLTIGLHILVNGLALAQAGLHLG